LREAQASTADRAPIAHPQHEGEEMSFEDNPMDERYQLDLCLDEIKNLQAELDAVRAERQRLIAAVNQIDFQQAGYNGFRYCLHIGDDGKFCGRATWWPGHDDPNGHKYVGALPICTRCGQTGCTCEERPA